MNARAPALPPAFAEARQQLRDYWRARAPRERLFVAIAGGAIVLLLIWWIFIAPAWRTLRETPAQLDSLDAQLQQLQRLAAETQTLKGAAPVTAAQAGLALKAASDRLGDKGKLTLLGDRATLTLSGANTEALRSWLLEARSAARVRPVEAQLTRGTQGYSGTIVVSLGTGSAP